MDVHGVGGEGAGCGEPPVFSPVHLQDSICGIPFAEFHLRGSICGVPFARFHTQDSNCGIPFARFHMRDSVAVMGVPGVAPGENIPFLLLLVLVSRTSSVDTSLQLSLVKYKIVMYSACYGRPGECAKETKKTPNFSGRKRGRERGRG